MVKWSFSNQSWGHVCVSLSVILELVWPSAPGGTISYYSMNQISAEFDSEKKTKHYMVWKRKHGHWNTYLNSCIEFQKVALQNKTFKKLWIVVFPIVRWLFISFILSHCLERWCRGRWGLWCTTPPTSATLYRDCVSVVNPTLVLKPTTMDSKTRISQTQWRYF